LSASGSRSFTRHTHSTFAVKVQRTTGEVDVPRSFAMGNLYPNPFNPITRFSFSVPVESRVRVTVYSLLGEEVAVLVNDNIAPGTYHQEWNATRMNGIPVSSGLYYVRFTASPLVREEGLEFSEIQKVLFIK
jgi:hypothetical protein